VPPDVIEAHRKGPKTYREVNRDRAAFVRHFNILKLFPYSFVEASRNRNGDHVMLAGYEDEQVLELGADGSDRSSALSWLSPVIVGLIAPAIATMFLVPTFAANSGTFITVLLLIALVVCVIAYAASAFVPGDPIGLELDRETRTVTIITASPFAVKRRKLDASEIAALRFSTVYDQDGYSENAVLLTTHDDETFEIAGDISPDHVDEARRILGFRAATRQSY